MVSFWFFNSRDGSVCRKANKLIFFYFLIGLIGCNLSGKQNVSLWSHVSWRHAALGHYSWGKASFFLGCRLSLEAERIPLLWSRAQEECQVLGQDAHIVGVFKCGLYTNSVTLYLWQPVCGAAVGSPGRKAASRAQLWYWRSRDFSLSNFAVLYTLT